MEKTVVESIPYSLYESKFFTGSSVICNPPVTNTDIDVMFLTRDIDSLKAFLLDNSFQYTTGDGYPLDDTFIAFRNGKYNVLVTDNISYYEKFEKATKLATKLNLLEKQQRIDLFDYVVRGNV